MIIELISGPLRAVGRTVLDCAPTAPASPVAHDAPRNLASASSEAADIEPLLEVTTRISKSMIFSFKS